MKVPNARRAVVDIRKLRDYCLNPDHPRGRHKARVFAATLGMTAADAENLRKALLGAVANTEARALEKDDYGQRYLVNCTISGPGGQATVRSIWIVRSGEDIPRLLTCYVP